MRRSFILLALLSGFITTTEAVGILPEASDAAGYDSAPSLEQLNHGAVIGLENRPRISDPGRPPDSLARTLLAQANGDRENVKLMEERARDKGQTKKNNEPAVPEAIVALIFGIFGILVVARRRLR